MAPDPEADPRAALRYSVSPKILQTAVFTLTVTETMTRTSRSFVTPAAAQLTPEVSTFTLEFTTVYGGAARLGDPWAVKEEQQTQSRTPRLNFVMNNSVVVHEGDYCWLRIESDSDPGAWTTCEVQVGPWADANTQPQFSMLLLSQPDAHHAQRGVGFTVDLTLSDF